MARALEGRLSMDLEQMPRAYVERDEAGGGRVISPFRTDEEMHAILNAVELAGCKLLGERIAIALEQIAGAITRPQRGTCRICGCSHFEPCEDGCGWADATQTLCDNPACLAAAGVASSDVEDGRHG
jgi:hypothetical protein